MKEELIKKHIVSWLSKYCDKYKKSGFIIGVSGGIDSAVTSKLCALTTKKTICVNMPIHQNSDQNDRANKHINYLKKNFSNVESINLNLDTAFNEFKKELKSFAKSQISFVNSKSRFRMISLYCIAQDKNALVVGTGNKVEDFGIGFYTKYGDGGVDLSPIADLMKSQVVSLAKHMSILKKIIEAPPTDGLWDIDRTDEEQIGASYTELEWAMSFNGKKETLSKREKEVLKIFRRFNKSNKHKMVPIPVCKIPNFRK